MQASSLKLQVPRPELAAGDVDPMFYVFDVFGRFPGKPCKSSLEVVRFNSTEHEPVVSHPSAKCSFLHVF